MIIALSGHAGCGKSSASDFICDAFDAVAIGQADPMKYIAAKVFGFSSDQLFGPSASRNAEDLRYPRPDSVRFAWCKDGRGLGSEEHTHGPECGDPVFLTPRHALQTLGSWGRECFLDVWTNAAIKRARLLITDGYDELHDQELPLTPSVVLITDVRYANEMQAIRNAGGRIIRIRRPGSGLSGEAAQHASETEQDAIPDSAFDGVIMNDGTLEQFRARTLAAIDALLPARAA